MTISMTIYREDDAGEEQEIDVRVHGSYTPGETGGIDRWGAPTGPSFDEEWGVERAERIDNGESIELTESEEMKAMKKMEEEARAV